ncbi:MAG: hypothetical protein HGGPFJEG_00422 [Ignavibacteria bacterium]|nr:hypothetical protein [Ignavibacteria bacterium]
MNYAKNIESLEIRDSSAPNSFEKEKGKKIYAFIYPLIIALVSFSGLLFESQYDSVRLNNEELNETTGGSIKNSGKFNILSPDDNSSGIKDTVYTELDTWLELRIDQQMLYQHRRDGSVIKYPVSTGNKSSGDPEALESRPGVFAIFLKVEHHKSSQFNSANMYHFMPFNQGIGFHSIDGTGYYSHLGVRPSSHGCIRMKHEHAKKLFSESPVGTLVLASRGYSARTIAFAEKDFKNEKNYEKDEMKYMLANNLYNIANGRYYLEGRKKFVVNPKYIPVSGIYNGYDLKLPEKQLIPRSFAAFYEKPDKLKIYVNSEIEADRIPDEFEEVLVNAEENTGELHEKNVNSSSELIKEYFNNPIGILPYFGPKK